MIMYFKSTMILLGVVLGFCWLTTAASAQVPAELIQYPQLILHNGTVLTVDDNDTVAQAVAIRDGEFLAVGSNAEVLRLAGPDTRKIDLEGNTVMPGILNTHTHPQKRSVSAYFNEVPRQVQESMRASGRIHEPRDKAHALAQIREIARRDSESEWVRLVGQRNDPAIFNLRIHELDEVVPDRPLMIVLSGWLGIVNSRAVEELRKIYPNPAGLLEEDGQITGHISSVAFWMMREELMEKPLPELIAPFFGRYLRDYLAPLGVTTFSTRLAAHEIQAYKLLDMRGEMPLRLAYGHEVGRWNPNPQFKRDMRRVMTEPQGYGSDRVWLNSISLALPDSSPQPASGDTPGVEQIAGPVCTTYPKIVTDTWDHWPEGDMCLWDIPGDPSRENLLHANRLGYRISNWHTQGDLGLQMIIDTLEKANRERPLQRYTGADHTVLLNPSVIERAGKLGMVWNTSSGLGAEAWVTSYGNEVVQRMYRPLRSLLEAGSYVSGIASFDGFARMVTRRNRQGELIGPREAVDRKTALWMMTRYGAKYVDREDVLGSIEPGKWADLVVIDRNPMAVSDEELYEWATSARDGPSPVRVLKTIVGGDVVYDRATFVPPAGWDRARAGQIFSLERDPDEVIREEQRIRDRQD